MAIIDIDKFVVSLYNNAKRIGLTSLCDVLNMTVVEQGCIVYAGKVMRTENPHAIVPKFKKGDRVLWDGKEFNVLEVDTYRQVYNLGGYIVVFQDQDRMKLLSRTFFNGDAKKADEKDVGIEPPASEFKKCMIEFYNNAKDLVTDKDGVVNRNDANALINAYESRLMAIARKQLQADFDKDVPEKDLTIHDMAAEYGKVNYIVRYTADGEREIDEDTGAEFFEDGANAAIDEIWDYISELPCKSKEEANNQKMLLAMIQKLKNG